MLGVRACWPQVVLWVPLVTYGALLWVPVTNPVVMPGVHHHAFYVYSVLSVVVARWILHFDR